MVERCEECGFDGDAWSNAAAIEAIEAMPARWRKAAAGLGDDVGVRPIPAMWSIAEYVDHVRETLFGMRFVLDIAVENPGTDLGQPPEPVFTAEPARIDVAVALDGIQSEASQLADRLRELPVPQWSAHVIIGGDRHDVHWVGRHAVHDASHHLLDVERLRSELTGS